MSSFFAVIDGCSYFKMNVSNTHDLFVMKTSHTLVYIQWAALFQVIASFGQPGASVSFTWGRDDTRMH